MHVIWLLTVLCSALQWDHGSTLQSYSSKMSHRRKMIVKESLSKAPWDSGSTEIQHWRTQTPRSNLNLHLTQNSTFSRTFSISVDLLSNYQHCEQVQHYPRLINRIIKYWSLMVRFNCAAHVISPAIMAAEEDLY